MAVLDSSGSWTHQIPEGVVTSAADWLAIDWLDEDWDAEGFPKFRYKVVEEAEFDYTILGVSVVSASGTGSFSISSGGAIIQEDMAFSTTVTNHTISGIIGVGADLTMDVLMPDGYFQSFKADFALKRVKV